MEHNYELAMLNHRKFIPIVNDWGEPLNQYSVMYTEEEDIDEIFNEINERYANEEQDEETYLSPEVSLIEPECSQEPSQFQFAQKVPDYI